MVRIGLDLWRCRACSRMDQCRSGPIRAQKQAELIPARKPHGRDAASLSRHLAARLVVAPQAHDEGGELMAPCVVKRKPVRPR